MICPDCGFDNIDGVDLCDGCGQPLVQFDPTGGELEESISRHSVQVLVPKDPISIDAATSVQEAVDRMVEAKIGCLLVVSDGKLTGIFSERDVLNKISSNPAALELPVSSFMTRSPVTITRRDSIAYALHAMKLGDYRHLPIVDDSGQPTGIISVRDILRFLCVRFAELRSKTGSA
jgi:CBS domain-containing protein